MKFGFGYMPFSYIRQNNILLTGSPVLLFILKILLFHPMRWDNGIPDSSGSLRFPGITPSGFYAFWAALLLRLSGYSGIGPLWFPGSFPTRMEQYASFLGL
jgi:hypothetical protein